MDKKFDEFLIKEYENIATAHFESKKQLATFFRYYMIFISLPVLIVSILEKKKDNTELGWFTMDLFSYILLGLAVVGWFFYWFVITLKYEAVLYARTVNGIRKYFYDSLNDAEVEKKIRTLPTRIDRPYYKSLYNPILIIILLVNTLYLSLSFYYLDILHTWCFYLVIVAFICLHILLNKFLTKKQIKNYPVAN